jgi:hypothetical protein
MLIPTLVTLLIAPFLFSVASYGVSANAYTPSDNKIKPSKFDENAYSIILLFFVPLNLVIFFLGRHKVRNSYNGGHSGRSHGMSGTKGQGRRHCRPHEGSHPGLLEILLEHDGEGFCSQFLNLPTTIAATTTQTVSDVEATATLTTTVISDPGTTTVSSTTTESFSTTLTTTGVYRLAAN